MKRGEKLNKSTVTTDHVVPLSRGGSDYIENIAPACLTCNVSKNIKSVLEFMFFKEIGKVA